MIERVLAVGGFLVGFMAVMTMVCLWANVALAVTAVGGLAIGAFGAACIQED